MTSEHHPTGKEIREWREAQGLDQKQLARRLKVSVEALSNRERGESEHFKSREGLLRALMTGRVPVMPARDLSNEELVEELLRRLDAASDGDGNDRSRS